MKINRGKHVSIEQRSALDMEESIEVRSKFDPCSPVNRLEMMEMACGTELIVAIVVTIFVTTTLAPT